MRLDGIFYAAFEPDRFRVIARHARDLAARGVECEVLDAAAARDEAPWCDADLLGGVIVRGEGFVHNRRLGRALVAACETRGVRVERAKQIEVECDARRVLGLRTDRGFVAARRGR